MKLCDLDSSSSLQLFINEHTITYILYIVQFNLTYILYIVQYNTFMVYFYLSIIQFLRL